MDLIAAGGRGRILGEGTGVREPGEEPVGDATGEAGTTSGHGSPVTPIRRSSRRVSAGWSNACFDVYTVPAGWIGKRPPRSSSSRAPGTLGESNLGAQNQSIDPSVLTREAVFRSPTSTRLAPSGRPSARILPAARPAGGRA